MLDAGWTKLINDSHVVFAKLPEFIVALLFGYLIIYLFLHLVRLLIGLFNLPSALVSIIYSLASVIIWILFSAYLLRTIGLSSLAITLSGSLLVLGLALANGSGILVSDVISGLFLAKDPDFEIGYRIKAGDTEGVIESIDIRKVRIRQDDGTLTVVPNSMIDKDRWQIIAKTKDAGPKIKIAFPVRKKKEL